MTKIASGESMVELIKLCREMVRNHEEHDCLVLRIHMEKMAEILAAAPSAAHCVCGEPMTLGVVHRTDGPCYHAAAPSAAPAAPSVTSTEWQTLCTIQRETIDRQAARIAELTAQSAAPAAPSGQEAACEHTYVQHDDRVWRCQHCSEDSVWE
jgi:hypothetical protein